MVLIPVTGPCCWCWCAVTLRLVLMAGEVTGEVFEWREDLEETEEVNLRGRAFPGSLNAINLRTAWGLSAPEKKPRKNLNIFDFPPINKLLSPFSNLYVFYRSTTHLAMCNAFWPTAVAGARQLIKNVTWKSIVNHTQGGVCLGHLRSNRKSYRQLF